MLAASAFALAVIIRHCGERYVVPEDFEAAIPSNVEDWAEIRRLHRAEGVPTKVIALRLGTRRARFRNALAPSAPPSYRRVANGYSPRASAVFIEAARKRATPDVVGLLSAQAPVSPGAPANTSHALRQGRSGFWDGTRAWPFYSHGGYAEVTDMAEADKAVQQIRATGAYRLLVVGYRCLLLGPLMMGLTIGAVALWSLRPPLVWVPITIGLGTVFVGAAGIWVGLITLYARRLMPRGGTNRHAALMRTLRRDVMPRAPCLPG